MTSHDVDYTFKLLLIGDAGVGKTSLLQRFTNNSFTQTYIATIGIDFQVPKVKLNGKFIKLQIWDTSGQERFRTITKAYFRGCHGIAVTYDVTKERSFSNLSYWLREVEEHAPVNVKKMLIGCKCDLEEKREVEYVTAKNFADHVQLPLREVSVKDSQVYVENAIMTLAAEVLEAAGRPIKDTSPSSD